jgi:protein gp37
MGTKIEWCDETINPIRTKEGGWHCVKSSPGCTNCYAEKINMRFGAKKPYIQRDVELVLNEKALEKPLKWKKPKRIFIQDMSDLFLDGIPYEYQYKTFKMVLRYPQHTFIMLTKHPKNMEYHFRSLDKLPPNLWLGVTAENQEQADKRIPILLQIPAAVRFVSVEPMLGNVDIMRHWYQWGCDGKSSNRITGKLEHIHDERCRRPLDWIIAGGESGPKARPMHLDWAKSLASQCQEANVPIFVKQLHINGKLNKNMAEWPEDLRIREFPNDIT